MSSGTHGGLSIEESVEIFKDAENPVREPSENLCDDSRDKTLIKEETDEGEAENIVKEDPEEELNENMKTLHLEDNVASGSESDEETKLATLSKFLSVAVKGKEGQKEILTNKGYGEFLVFCLMDESVNVIRSVMEVLEVLVSNRRNHSLLQELAYFMNVLESFDKKRGIPEDLKQDALKLHRTLQNRRMPLNNRHNSINNSSVINSTSTLERSKQRNGVETVFVIHHGVLQQAYGRNRIAKELIKVKGIISVTYDPLKSHCIVRRKRSVEANLFGSAIANLGYEVSMMCRNEAKDWILVPVTADNTGISELQENMPEYLPEEEDAPIVGENAVCKPGGKDSKEDEISLLDSAKSFLRRSFFW